MKNLACYAGPHEGAATLRIAMDATIERGGNVSAVLGGKSIPKRLEKARGLVDFL
jgi:hypothetical protein